MSRGESDRTLELLDWLSEEAEAAGRIRSLVEILALRALILYRQKAREAALSTLEESLALAEPGRLVRVFADEGPAMAKLFAEAEKRAPLPIPPGYARSLTLAFRPRHGDHVSPAASELLEPLSDREIEVLRTVAAGLTNREAARKLFVEPSTVKKHLEHIYGKLGVRNRTQSVARARELELL